MKKVMKKRLLILLAVFLVVAIGFVVVSIIVENKNNTLYKVEQDFTRLGADSFNYYTTYEVSKSWIESDGTRGGQYDATFVNKGQYPLKDWTIVIDVPEGSRVDSYWSGVFKYDSEKHQITVTALDYNETVLQNNQITFGWVMYTPQRFEVNHSVTSVHKTIQVTDMPIFWVFMGIALLAFILLVVIICISINEKSYINKQNRDRSIIVQSLITFANFIDAKDTYTKGHSSRVAAYSREIVKRMSHDNEMAEDIYYMALLHDVGKIAVADVILNKPGALSPEERKVIETHTVKGGKILKDFTALPGISDGAMYHHERYGGGGYPTGIKGEEIPLCARVICIADSYDAMASDRCYRKRLDRDIILSELKSCAGSQFDPSLVGFMVGMIEDGTAERIEREANDSNKNE